MAAILNSFSRATHIGRLKRSSIILPRRTGSEYIVRARGGCTRGRQPSCGGSRQHRCLPALFAGEQRASGVGGYPPAPACPLGETGKGDQIPRCRRPFWSRENVHLFPRALIIRRPASWKLLLPPPLLCRASIRTPDGPPWARCMLRSDFKPRSVTPVKDLGCWVLPSSYRSWMDQPIMRSHPNKAVDGDPC